MSKTLSPPVWVSTKKGLIDLVNLLWMQPVIAIDTESNSLHAYRERVCLIQISTQETDYLVDPLALDEIDPLGEIISSSKIEKIFHAAEYDLICIKRDFGISATNIFDTRWAVRILGYQSDGLDRLLSIKFDVQVNKKYQKANWAIRPLSAEQINYARMDTHYLIPLKNLLQVELEEKQLLQLAHEDFERACKVEIPPLKPVLWERMAYSHNFSKRELTILRELFECRERIAQELDRPPFKVVGDKRLFEIAKLPPKHTDELFGLGLSNKQVSRWGRAILQAVAKGISAPEVQIRKVKRPDDAFLSRLDSLKTWRKGTARKMNVQSDVILPKQLMELIADIGPDNIQELSQILNGSTWRMSQFGTQILQAVKG